MKFLKNFLKLESSSGILLMFAVVLALFVSNSEWNNLYNSVLNTKLLFKFGDHTFGKPLILWINDGLMAIFFLLIGLELKREVVDGFLKERDNIVLPIIGAAGGLIVPAIIYYLFNCNDPIAIRGWAIPAATDIAFALGVLSLLGNRVPKSAKIFLLALAIFDDLAAIIIIALFYTTKISFVALLLSIIGILVLACLNRSGVKSLIPYMLAGIFLWTCVLKSGVHATLAGVITGLFIPIKPGDSKNSPLHTLEHALHPWVAYAILPIFAFANSSLEIPTLLEGEIFNPITLGSALGLFFGKQIGVFSFCMASHYLFGVKLPEKLSILGLYSVSIITGIGFTMSLFIASLAFGNISQEYIVASRLGIIIGSLLSAVIGLFIMWFSCRNSSSK